MAPPPIKPFRRFNVKIQEVDEYGRPTGNTAEQRIEANGNPELFAKTGGFIRQFSEDHIEEWRRKL